MVGRKREFDKQSALHSAMILFWQKGYGGTSLSDLTSAMQVNKPSMYAAFGNKEQLFIAATQYYLENYADKLQLLLEQEGKSLVERVEEHLIATIAMQCCDATPYGCFVAFCSAEKASEEIPVQASEQLEQTLVNSENFFVEFFKAEKVAGNLIDSANPEQLALQLLVFVHGTASMARCGKTQKELLPIVDEFLVSFKQWCVEAL